MQTIFMFNNFYVDDYFTDILNIFIENIISKIFGICLYYTMMLIHTFKFFLENIALWGSLKTGPKVVNFDESFLCGFWPKIYQIWHRAASTPPKPK